MRQFGRDGTKWQAESVPLDKECGTRLVGVNEVHQSKVS
jgi:hypothetical protein